MIHFSSRRVPVDYFAPTTAYVMWSVVLALMPAIVVLVIFSGSRWIGLILLAILSAWFFEALILRLRGKAVLPHLKDGTATLTALLLVLSLPVTVPAWLVIIGVGFALIFAKHLYGGMGMNPFNPAMVGFAFLLVSFPAAMGQHASLSVPLSSFWQTFDATTAATLLDYSRQLRIDDASLTAITWLPSWQRFFWLLAVALGGCYLLKKRLLDARLPIAVLLSAFLTALLFWLIDADRYLNPAMQLFSGATFFGAWFVATDPVTAAATPFGRYLYGSIIGVLTVCIRNLGNFPDGFAFAVLCANALVPVLDYIFRPHYR